MTWTFGASFVVFAMLLVGVVGWQGLHELISVSESKGAALATVLLALPAFLLALIAGRQEHVIVSRVLRPARWVAILTSMLMIVAATVLIVVPPPFWGWLALGGMCAAQGILATTSWLIRRASDPGPIVRGRKKSKGMS